MGRPTRAEKRDKQLNLKLTAREHAWVQSRAKASGKRLVDFGRAMILADRPLPARLPGAPTHLDPLFLACLSRIGNNLNQIARRLHEFDVTAPADLEPVLAALREMFGKVRKHGP